MKFTNTWAPKPLDINYFKSIKLIDCEFLSHISTWQFFKTREKYKFPGADVSLTNPVSCFGKDGVIAYSTQLFTQDAFFSDWNIIKNKNEISIFVSLEAIEQIGFFFIYLNRNLPQSCTFVSTGWTNVCNIAIQDTPRDLPSIHKCSNLSGYPTLTSLASRMVSNTISRILMKWSGYGQMDQCCTVWGEWGLDMSIYSPGGERLLGLIFAGYVSLASQNPYPIIFYS